MFLCTLDFVVSTFQRWVISARSWDSWPFKWVNIFEKLRGILLTKGTSLSQELFPERVSWSKGLFVSCPWSRRLHFLNYFYIQVYYVREKKRLLIYILLFVGTFGRSYFPKWCATENASFILYLFCHMFVVESSMDS